MEDEDGTIFNITFPAPRNARMYDANGDVVLCKCGKPAGSYAPGKEAFIAWCSDCSPLTKQMAELVYKEPSQEQKQLFKDKKLLTDGFVIDAT